MAIDKSQIETVLGGIVDPNMESDLVSSKAVKSIEQIGGNWKIVISLGYPAAGYFDELRQQIVAALAELDGIGEVEVEVSSQIKSHAVQQNLKPLPGIKNIIAVASGKGGVGKSTTAVNLALALQAEGARVGILDADIYGPSVPRMLGCRGQPESTDGKSLEPMIGHGIQSMSIGYLVEEDTPMIWRGPMVTQALEQLLNDTHWNDIDYLIIDLPPGTGDTQLTLAQRIPVSGAVIVTTPQDIALLDARKGLKMFEKVEVPVLGIIENMSIHICSQCGHSEHIFGEGGGER
ncbi:MAG TPA: iron-sulfur cluster carrier protein ApbC, partial [Gammaproteobacteria bacterium]|nr:iron-sulfur cluster carrier protein ApbC [Gammaproteobacteria bacterium]